MEEGKQRILVVDDEPQLTRVLRRSLMAKGYDVRIAGDGEFALQTFHDWPPALVITDLAMPNLSGLGCGSQSAAQFDAPAARLCAGRDHQGRGAVVERLKREVTNVPAGHL